MEGPPVPLCQPATPPPTGAHKKEPCKRFFRDEKNREQFACAAASTLLALALGTVPLFCLKSPLAGDHPQSGEQLELSWPSNGRVGPVDIPTSRCPHCKACVKRAVGHLRIKAMISKRKRDFLGWFGRCMRDRRTARCFPTPRLSAWGIPRHLTKLGRPAPKFLHISGVRGLYW